MAQFDVITVMGPSDTGSNAMVDGATYFAWFVIAFLFLVLVWVIVFLGSLPKKIAVNRNHPQVDAINAASWVGLALAGVGWPIALVWAFLRSGRIGSGENSAEPTDQPQVEIGRLQNRIVQLEAELQQLKANKG